MDEEEHVLRRNREAVDKVEAKNGRVDHPAGIASFPRDECTETYQHDHEKAGACSAVEPRISLHFAPDVRFAFGELRRGLPRIGRTAAKISIESRIVGK
jgi:hypothetical protein